MILLKKYLPKSAKSLIKNLLRIFDVILMMITLHIFPQQTYRFSTRKALPSKKYRMKKYNLNEIPYKLLANKSSILDEFEEIDAIGIGTSFDFEKLKNIQKPTYLLSFWNSLKIDEHNEIAYSTKEIGKYYKFWDTNRIIGHNRNIKDHRNYNDYVNPNITYVVTHHQLVKKLSESGHKVLVVHTYRRNKKGELISDDNKEDEKLVDIYKKNNVKKIAILDEVIKYPTEKPFLGSTQLGSLITYLAAVSFFSKKINVYGWDFFLNESPENMSHLKLIFNMYSYKADLGRSTTHFEEALFNFYFGYHFSLNKKFDIYSYMGKLDRHKYLIKKIEKALFI